MKQRYEWLDLWRTLAVLTMLVFHAMWDLELFGILPAGMMETPAADVVRACMEQGVLCLTAKDKVRLLPALNIPMPLLERAAGVLLDVCR